MTGNAEQETKRGLTLRAAAFLDPRPLLLAEGEPFADAVNIPLDDLTARTHELPPADEPIQIVGDAALAAATIERLRAIGRVGLHAGPGTPANAAVRGRLWRPTPFLEQEMTGITATGGRALDVACGSGRDAIYLAAAGWCVDAIDILPDALQRAAELARRLGIAASMDDSAAARMPGSVHFQRVDLERDPPCYDGAFDLIVSFRYLHRPLFPLFKRWLRPGGRALIETFTTLHRDRHGKPRQDAHVLLPGELPGLFHDLQIVNCDECWRGDIHVSGVHARRE